ncbi:MAG: MarR family transcriptional regulator [Eubacteriales bacterium]
MSASDENRLRELVRLLERKLGYLQDAQFTCCGVSLAQCHALVEIGRAGSLSLNVLAEVLGLDTSTMSRTVNNLVKNHIAKRTEDAKDRRCVCIELTGKGKALFERIETDRNAYYVKILESIPEEKREQVLDSIQLLANAIDQDCCKIC